MEGEKSHETLTAIEQVKLSLTYIRKCFTGRHEDRPSLLVSCLTL